MPAALTSFSATADAIATPAITPCASFTALRKAAPALGETMTGDVFYSLDWFETLYHHGFAQAAPLELLLAETPGHAPICLPLVAGTEIAGLSNFYSALFGPIGQIDAAAQDALDALARHLHQDQRRWPLLTLQPLDQEAPFLPMFSRSLRTAGYWVDDFHCFGNWTLHVAGRNYEQYHGTLPSRLQNTIRRARRKLERAGNLHTTIEQAAGESLTSAIADFEAIYAASWKTPEPFPQFISAWCRRAAERGWLRLGVLRLDGQALAAQLWLVKDGKASIFKLAYREGAQPYSPGSVLTAELMRRVIDTDGVHEVDFLSGDDAYKQDWMSHRRTRVGLVAFRPTHWRGLLAAGRHTLGKWRRRWQEPKA